MGEFIKTFADIAEHSPWVAEAAANFRPFTDRAAMIDAFQQALNHADKADQLTLIRAHPDLAGKAKLTQDSKSEQQGAGLDSLTKDELASFTQLNQTYKDKFEFPFIFAVKGADKTQILASFALRVTNDIDREFETALQNICRIFMFRLEDQIK